MGEKNYNHKPLRRTKALLEFLLNRSEDEPEKELFYFDPKELLDFHPLLAGAELLEDAFNDIGKHTDTKLKMRKGAEIKTTTGLSYELSIWAKVGDVRKLRDYFYEKVEELKNAETIQNFVLTDEGIFYLEGARKLQHEFDPESKRFKLLNFLAKKKTYVPVSELAGKFTGGNRKRVRGLVGEIRQIVDQEMKVPGDSIFESDGKSGYRVTNVAVEDEPVHLK